MEDDKQIWNEFKRENDIALSCIYHRNIDFLYGYGRKFSKDDSLILDTIQDLFYDLIRNRKNLGTTDNIRLYLIKSFRRRLIREIQRSRKQNIFQFEGEHVDCEFFSIEDDWVNAETQDRRSKYIHQALLALNVKQREILYYKFYCGFDYDQICEIMFISYDSARQLVSRAIQSLKKSLTSAELFFLFLVKKIRL
jgi:RNA polymerase sigma factor (sigma-70 family)